jgi:hypothetical protein
MESNLAANQPEQATAAPVLADSAPAADTENVSTPVEKPAKPEREINQEAIERRFAEITATWRQVERRAMTAEQRAAQLEQQLKQIQTQKEESPKKLEDFGYDEIKYQDYLDKRAETRAAEAAKRAIAEQETLAQKERRLRKFKEREAEYEKTAKDYREVAYSDFPLSNELLDVVMDLESGPELIHYLGKNKQTAFELSDLPVHIAAVRLGRIDAQIATDKAAKAAALEAAKAAKAVSQAPPPAPKLEGTNAKVEKDPSQMSDEEFAKWRKRQIAQRR